MKTKAFSLTIVLLLLASISMHAQSIAATKKAVKEVLAEVIAASDSTSKFVVRGTIYKNSSQYSLDSLKYSAEIQIAKLKLEQKKDSAMYARMSTQQIFEMEMKKNNRYYRSASEEFWGNSFPPIFVGLSLLYAFYLLLKMRDNGKKRSHEYRMASVAKISTDGSSPTDSEFINESGRTLNAAQMYEDSKESLSEYLKSPSKYKRTGILFLLAGVGIMVMFLTIGGYNAPWGLGIVPIFIGVAYLYLDYSNVKTIEEKERQDMYSKYKQEKKNSSKSDTEDQQDQQ